MKEVIIRFLGLGYNEFWQADVDIYDVNNFLIFSGVTYNSRIVLCLARNRLYRLRAKSLNDIIDVYFYVLNDDEYVFIFNRSFFKYGRTITFLLTDYYYNLPIEKGNLYLWQK